MQRAYDQVLHDVCLQKTVSRSGPRPGGFVGDDGPTHHGLFDYAYIRSIPNIIAMAPKDENELQHMLKTAVECGLPVSVRYPRGQGVGVVMDETPANLAIGKGEVVCEGSDLAIVAIGSTVYPPLRPPQNSAKRASASESSMPATSNPWIRSSCVKQHFL